MAVNEKAPITVALQNGGTPYSLHHDLAGHFRMDRAVVGIYSCLGKRVRELLIRVHHLGLEHAVCAHGRMRNIITVCPGNCCSDGYPDRLRSENEIIDFHGHVCRGGLVAATCDDPATSSNMAIIAGTTTPAIRTFFFVIICFLKFDFLA
jgi:hypothetical protein